MIAGSTGKYHIYQRTIKESATGKPVRAWYYWYLDDDGKQIRRSCGQSKLPCLLRRDAEAAIAEIEHQEAMADEKSAQALRAARAVRFKDIAAGMYEADGKHMKLRVERGEGLTDTTMAECRGYLKRWIIPKWGDSLPAEIRGAAVEDWLLEVKRSNSFKNRCLEVMNEVFSECVRYEIISDIPKIVRLKRRSRKQSVLETKEIAALFPDTAEGLAAIWKETDPREPPGCGLMFGALFLLMLATGARSGEARAIRYSQIDRKRAGLIIDQSLDAKQRIVGHLKKGDDDDPRLRASIIPSRAMRALEWWIAAAPPPKSDDDLVFMFKGKHVTKDHLVARFATGLKNAKVNTVGRRITPHALRYTYTTRMRRLIPGDPLRLMTGHQDADMTDYYTRTELEGQLTSLQEYRPAIERFWG